MFEEISVVVLAAGESLRMGQPKLILPWGGTTVLGKVVATFAEALASSQETDAPVKPGVSDIVIVTGGARRQIEALVSELAKAYPVRAVYNPAFAHGGMLSSIQAGLRSLGPDSKAALIGLGDQPQVQVETLRCIYSAYSRSSLPLIIPSFQNRRGHPWLADRSLWPEILALPASATARQFLNAHKDVVEYVQAGESILQDLDTPEDYSNLRPNIS
jgi:molybdenum cofactor cytidylyltransferase